MPKAYMVLYLDGPFQSYGINYTEKLKGTEVFPSKSAVIGLLGCSLGITREQREKLSELSHNLRMAVRLDRGGRKITDYQNVAGAYVLDTSKENKGKYKCRGHITVEALIKGNKAASSDNKLIDKEYLMDTAFTVVLEGEEELLKECEEAIKNPKWIYSLGRYNCVPSVPIYGTIVDREFVDKVIYTEFTSLEEAISKVPHCSRYDKFKDKFMVQIEVSEEEAFSKNTKRMADSFEKDTYVGTSSYGNRYVYNTYVSA